MCASDVTATLDQALAASGLDRATVMHRPRLLSDNGSSYVASDLAAWLEDKGMEHVRGAPYHPQTQGKIERWHQTLKNRILLDNYYLPGDLERQINAFVAHYNHVRYHESINNLTPADVYFGRAETILAERQRIKRVTIANRRLQHQLAHFAKTGRRFANCRTAVSLNRGQLGGAPREGLAGRALSHPPRRPRHPGRQEPQAALA